MTHVNHASCDFCVAPDRMGSQPGVPDLHDILFAPEVATPEAMV